MSNHLPMTRVKTIMKSSADVETISKESLLLVSLATEMFIKHLAISSEKAAGGKEIEYKHVAEVVNTSERFDFLTEIIPKKITVRQFKKYLAEKKNTRSFSESSGSSDSEGSDSRASSDSEDHSAHSPSHSEAETESK